MVDTATKIAQQPDIPLPNTGTRNEVKFISENEFNNHKKDFNFQKKILNWTFVFIVAILIVCFIAFMTFITDAWKFHSNTTKEYHKTLQELKSKNVNLKIEQIQTKIDILEKKTDNLELLEKTIPEKKVDEKKQ